MLWLLERTGLPRWAIIVLALASMLALTATSAAIAGALWRAQLGDARDAGKAEMRATYEALIAKSNAEAEAAQAAAARAAAAAEAEAARLAATLSETLARMEAADAALPNGDSCGLDAARRRLLP
jgi:hypothetical protein